MQNFKNHVAGLKAVKKYLKHTRLFNSYTPINEA